jgi:hypothetical protein
MGIKRIKTRSQRITSFGYLKKIQDQRTAASSGYFKKTSQNCLVSRKPGKEEPGRFLGGYFTFTIWDMGFKTSTDGQMGSAFQDLDRQTHRSGFQDLDRRDLGFRTSTERQTTQLIFLVGVWAIATSIFSKALSYCRLRSKCCKKEMSHKFNIPDLHVGLRKH